MSENREKIKIGLVIVFIAGIVLSMAFFPALKVKETNVVQKEPTWHPLGDYNPGAGKGGYQRIVVKELPSGSSTTPNTNISVAVNWTDISADNFNSEIPHSKKFGIYIYARFNATQAYSAGNATWVQAWIRCRITSADLNIAADTVMNKSLVVAAGTVMLYEVFYLELNASAKPLWLYRDSDFDITSIKLEAYY